MSYSPSRLPYHVNGEKEGTDLIPAWITADRKGQILTASWHWNAPFGLLNTKEHPWYSGFYTNPTTFELSRAMREAGSPERKGIERALDAIAIDLGRLQNAHIPVLWRPLHEADGGWFWWELKVPNRRNGSIASPRVVNAK